MSERYDGMKEMIPPKPTGVKRSPSYLETCSSTLLAAAAAAAAGVSSYIIRPIKVLRRNPTRTMSKVPDVTTRFHVIYYNINHFMT